MMDSVYGLFAMIMIGMVSYAWVGMPLRIWFLRSTVILGPFIMLWTLIDVWHLNSTWHSEHQFAIPVIVLILALLSFNSIYAIYNWVFSKAN